MDAINISTRREVCWDEYLIDRVDGVSVKMHKPEYRGSALTCDMPWEGNICGYFQVIRDNRKYRLYYRGASHEFDTDGNLITDERNKLAWLGCFCYAESTDGKTFTRPDLGVVNFDGTTKNNLFIDEDYDNLCIFKDDNPDCPADERYKALGGTGKQELMYYKSTDGVHFVKVGVLLDDGAYDSLNLAFWDKTRNQYFLYYRGIHHLGEEYSDGKWHDGEAYDGKRFIRDVRVRTSKDFRVWDTPRQIEFDKDQDDYQLYTSQIKPYYRAPHVFLGMPNRYVERPEDKSNFKYLPNRKFRADLTRTEGRSGYAFTDSILMTSRDGYHFRRTDEVFMSPEIEMGANWYYGNNDIAWGIAETKSDRPGFPNEISIYSPSKYRTEVNDLDRYVIRIDGFFSWNCKYKPGYVLTKPLIFKGPDLEINFATSALGYVRIKLCDEDGNELEGFDSGRLFGDSLDRPVDFDGDLKTLIDKPIRMRIEMSDADLYSFRFNSACPI